MRRRHIKSRSHVLNRATNSARQVSPGRTSRVTSFPRNASTTRKAIGNIKARRDCWIPNVFEPTHWRGMTRRSPSSVSSLPRIAAHSPRSKWRRKRFFAAMENFGACWRRATFFLTRILRRTSISCCKSSSSCTRARVQLLELLQQLMLVRRKIRVRKNVALRQHAPKFSMAAKNLLRLHFERGECAAILGKLLTELGERRVIPRQCVGSKTFGIQQSLLAFIFPMAFLVVDAFRGKLVTRLVRPGDT